MDDQPGVVVFVRGRGVPDDLSQDLALGVEGLGRQFGDPDELRHRELCVETLEIMGEGRDASLGLVGPRRGQEDADHEGIRLRGPTRLSKKSSRTHLSG